MRKISQYGICKQVCFAAGLQQSIVTVRCDYTGQYQSLTVINDA